MNKIKSGDVVVLKSGGPEMTVTSAPEQDQLSREFFVNCKWFDSDNKLCSGNFNVNALKFNS